ncbi:hypothetical protein J6590_017917 [Homalodisca vitripennis]|nr:hypothetical protein J6590_017917 [Homalodisca vitripennis]
MQVATRKIRIKVGEGSFYSKLNKNLISKLNSNYLVLGVADKAREELLGSKIFSYKVQERKKYYLCQLGYYSAKNFQERRRKIIITSNE